MAIFCGEIDCIYIFLQPRVREAEDLPGVGGVGEALGVADHPRVEDHLAVDGRLRAEAVALEDRAVRED